MIGNSALLDTNIVIALFNGEKGIAEKLDKLKEVFIPSIVAGELYYGAYSSASKIKNLAKINSFTGSCLILEVDEITASFYGEIKSTLKKKGTPIPENDIWIAALAAQHNLSVITRDSHFKNITQLSIVGW